MSNDCSIKSTFVVDSYSLLGIVRVTMPLLSPPELDKLGEIDEEIKSFLDDGTVQAPGLPGNVAEEPETVMKEIQAAIEMMPVPPPIPDVEEQTDHYTTRDGTSLRICVYRPTFASKPLPLMVWLHGGGGCIGKPEFNASLLRTIVQDHGCVVVAPQYRLAPQFKFPTGVNDAWDALQHIAGNAMTRYNADARLRFVLGGESAGATMSAVLTHRARDARLDPPMTGVFLSAGSYFNPSAIPSEYQEHYRSRTDPVCEEGPMLSKATKRALDVCFQGDYSSSTYRAALCETGHANLPKHYVQTCGLDINRDDGILYTDLLQKHGVETKLDIYSGAPHCFWHRFSATDLGDRWKKETREGLAFLLASKRPV